MSERAMMKRMAQTMMVALLVLGGAGCHDNPASLTSVHQASGVLNGGVLNGGVLNGGVLNGGVLNGGVLNGGVLNGGVSSVAGATGCRFGRCANGARLPPPRL
jgi:hypothetical protein